MIPVTVLNFDIVTKDQFNLGYAPGSSLRGALYVALTTMYDTQRHITPQDDMDENPVAWLLRMEDDSLSGGKDIPRPIAVRPPLNSTGETLTFGLAFYGRAIEAIPMVVSAIPTMGKIGVGRGRATFELREVRSVDPLTGREQILIDANSQTQGTLPQPPTIVAYERLSVMLAPDRLQLQFRTPTRIVDKGRLCHQPEFRPLFQRLLERIRTLSTVYTDDPVWIPFKDLLDAAAEIKLVQDNTHWFEAWSGSRRDGMVKPVSGYIGTATYEGDIAALLPYLLLGQGLQVGKNTIKGCGWYEMLYQWA